MATKATTSTNSMHDTIFPFDLLANSFLIQIDTKTEFGQLMIFGLLLSAFRLCYYYLQYSNAQCFIGKRLSELIVHCLVNGILFLSNKTPWPIHFNIVPENQRETY